MEPEGSLPHSQDLATYPDTEQSQPRLPPHFLYNIFNIIFPSTTWSSLRNPS